MRGSLQGVDIEGFTSGGWLHDERLLFLHQNVTHACVLPTLFRSHHTCPVWQYRVWTGFLVLKGRGEPCGIAVDTSGIVYGIVSQCVVII